METFTPLNTLREQIIEDCISLKKVIQQLIDQCALNEYKAWGDDWVERAEERVEHREENMKADDRCPQPKVIYFISTEYPSTN